MNPVIRVALMLCLIGAAPLVRGEQPARPSDAAAVRKLVATLRAAKTTNDRLEQTVAALAAMKPDGVSALDDYVTREVSRLASVAGSGPQPGPLDEEIAKLREVLRRLREAADLTKEQLEKEGLPALESLTVAWSKREAALAPWHKQKQVARMQVERLTALVAAWQAADADAPVAGHLGALGTLTTDLAPDNPESARVLADNKRIASGLPAEVVTGMNAVNAIRVSCGLPPLIFDAKLCEAAAMHSRDMESKGFFAHESPLPGKAAFTDRAKLAGTTASGENIFMGSTSGGEAVKAWFVSPGHHKNMLTSEYTRQGLGCAGKHWTQLFGR